ncbi:leucine-rich repeat-containing protein 61-like [Asterias amurensis]|uniref:leucine-rich repeat-containing protein 61-like n=1 Tax=Asterias amurensis TaxID=7602 RepID=UPI003AB2F947
MMDQQASQDSTTRTREKTDLLTGLCVNKQILKTRSGEFDIESIHSLHLREMDIDNLGCIGDCTYLERLDISRNDLVNLRPLTPLKQLSYLNISANRITDIDPLKELVNLQKLNASGNLIGSSDSLQSLSSLDYFTSLILHDAVTDLNNPICLNASYKANVMAILPRLTTLDGERVTGKGSELYQLCKKLDAMLEDEAKASPPTRTAPEESWVSKDFWQLKAPGKTEETGWEVEKQFQDILKSCRDLELDASRSLMNKPEKPTI